VAVGEYIPRVSESKYKNTLSRLSPIEAYSPLPENTVYSFQENNMLAKMVHAAFYKHYPIELSPDAIWFTIAQGFGHHINNNSEKLRHKFVNFSGKETLVVNRPEFVKGSPDNDWEGVFPEFAERITGFIGNENADLIQNNFSTTTPTDRIASQIVLMSAMQAYFEYAMMCGCGIPYVQLLGTEDDWIQIRQKAEQLRDFELDWWVDELLPVLDHFVQAAQGNPDVKFWQSINNISGASGFGATPVNGWLQVFFPYIGGEANRKNSCMGEWKKFYAAEEGAEFQTGERRRSRAQRYSGAYKGYNSGQVGYGVSLKDFPNSMSTAPLKYTDIPSGNDYKFVLCGGLVAVVQDPNTSALRCVSGWAVLDATEKDGKLKIGNAKHRVGNDLPFGYYN